MMNVVFGLEHLSPLSLEIVALSLFGGSAAAYTGMRLFDILPRFQTIVMLAAMGFGIVLVLAISQATPTPYPPGTAAGSASSS